MQDGTLFDAGERFELKRAVHIFAGGTADRMSDFGTPPGVRFREAKGPDFVSRLRGHVDVRGPNDQARTMLRRALIMRRTLERVACARRGDDKAPPLQLTTRMLDAMLHVVAATGTARGPSPRSSRWRRPRRRSGASG